MTERVGILAYGSVITDPGKEIAAATVSRQNVKTPFAVEFARSSSKRGGAPTLVPVESGGAPVSAALIEVCVGLVEAKNILYRREIDEVKSGKAYVEPPIDNTERVRLVTLLAFAELDFVIYAKIAANIVPLDAEHLANLAISSVSKAKSGKDGITYLADALQTGIETPLLAEHEAAILRKANARDRMEAHTKVLGASS